MDNTPTLENLPDELEDLEICTKEGRAARCVRRSNHWRRAMQRHMREYQDSRPRPLATHSLRS